MIKERSPNWLDNILRGAPAPKPPALGSQRVKDLARRGLLVPATLTCAEVQELSAAVISHLVESKS